MKPQTPKYLFHVTPDFNCASIETHGIDARQKFKRRKDDRNYFVAADKVAWAIAHVSSRHDTPVDNIAVYRIETTNYKVVRFFNNSIYFIRGAVAFEYETVWQDATFVLAQIMRDEDLTKYSYFRPVEWLPF